MRSLIAPLAAFLTTAGSAQVPVDIKRVEIAPGIHQFTVAADGYVEALNSVAIVGGDEVLVFDTTTRPSTARTILGEIRKLTDKPVRVVVNSHWHPDHWSGNEVFAAANPSLKIVATELELDFMHNTAAFWRTYLPNILAQEEKAATEQLAGSASEAEKATLRRELQLLRDMVAEQMAVKRTFPNVTYTDRMMLRTGGRDVELISVTGDAAGTTAMWLPNERILVTGDAVSYPLPYYTPPLSEHARSLRMLAALNPAIIVPGHGPAFRDTGFMLLEAEFFEDVVRQTRSALRGGAATIEDVQGKIDFSGFTDRFAQGDKAIADAFQGYSKRIVRRAFIELRDSKEIPPPRPPGQ